MGRKKLYIHYCKLLRDSDPNELMTDWIIAADEYDYKTADSRFVAC